MKKILFSLLIFIQAFAMEAPPSVPTELDIRLLEAVEAGRLNEAELLLLAGANPNIQIRLWGYGPQMTALQAATRVPDIRMYHLIKNNGGNPGAVDTLLINVLEGVIFADPQQQKNYQEMKNIVIADLIADPRTNLNAYPTYSLLNPLSWAVTKKNEELIKSLLATKRVDVNAENASGQTALDLAKTKKIKKLIEEAGGHAGSRKRKVPTAKAEPTVIHATPMQRPSSNIPSGKPTATAGQKRKESEPWKAFTAEPFKAARQEPIRRWEAAPVDFVNMINYAIEVNDIEQALHYLNRGGFDINKEGTETGDRILTIAIRRNALPIVQRLIQMPELQVNYRDKFGLTPLMIAAQQGFFQIVQELLKRKDLLINEVSSFGRTALEFTAIIPDPTVKNEMIRLLRAFGARTGAELRGGPQPQPQYRVPAKKETTQFPVEVYAKLGLTQLAAPEQILGVDKSASAEDIKAAFKRKTLEWHPDRNADPLAKEVFQLINWAYNQLKEK